MERYQVAIIGALLIFSVIAVFAPPIIYRLYKVFNKAALDTNKKATVSRMLLFSGFLIIAVWCLRYAVGLYTALSTTDKVSTLNWGEEIFNSLLHALQTFSMDEDYTTYILNGKKMLGDICGEDTAWKTIYGLYASVLNFVAPIAGGAIIFEILASVFPKSRLWFSHIIFWKEKYYFSELNATSLSLAKSIYEKEKAHKPVLIFTDTYVDEENEKEYELLLEAKKYGAICIRDDLAHVAKTCHGKRAYFLMDENEFGNLQTLMGLTEDHNIKFIRNSHIFLFVQSDAYVQLEKQINKKLEEKKELLKGGEKPTIVPVNGYRNLVHNLFVDVPLYEPLINKKDKTKLNVTILGNGIIGTEAFLSAYWFGQMLISDEDKKSMSECDMTVNVVSKDDEEIFWSKIDYINPEIKKTVGLLQNGVCNNSELLVYNNEGNTNNPYCHVRYIKADVKIGGFWDGDSKEAKELLDSDYFIVALGNDADNISVADKLRRLIGKKHLEERDDNCSGTVIAYAVFNSELANTLNRQKCYQCRNEGKTDIYTYAFGSLEQVYSCDNVYMSRYKILAELIGAPYDKSQMRKRLKDDNTARKSSDNSNYNYWANLARAMHIKYKVFSLGLIKESIFDYNQHDLDSLYKAYIEKQCKEYINIVLSDSHKEFCTEVVYKELHSKKHLLAWLEHRRWNAFTRTMGYQYTCAESLFNVKNAQKDMDLKLHSCLVEARLPRLADDDTYIYAEFTENDLVDKSTALDFSGKMLDRLDMVSYERQKRNLTVKTEDFKMYDYYRYEFYDYFDAKDLAQMLENTKSNTGGQ